MKLKSHTKILVLGCGGVGTCVVHMLLETDHFDARHLTLLDKSSSPTSCSSIAKAIQLGAKFIEKTVTQENYESVIRTVFPSTPTNDESSRILIDLSFGVSSLSLLRFCQTQGVMYINTAIEKWDAENLVHDGNLKIDNNDKDWTSTHSSLYERTLYARHREIEGCRFPRNGPTAVLEHGCNPGLVSHFVRAALDNIALEALADVPDGARSSELRDAVEKKDYAAISMQLRLRVVHISEIDDQISARSKEPGEFVNTWSPMGFAEEAIDWVQVGWGTHERPLPGMLVPTQGSQGQIFLPKPAMDQLVSSYVPFMPITGMCIPHGEADSIANFLTVEDAGPDVARTVYRPSVYYVYKCCDVAMESLEEIRRNGYCAQEKFHVLTTDDKVTGTDAVGVLLIFESDPHDTLRDAPTKKPWSYWYGSVLGDRNSTLKYFNPTVIQVAGSVVAAFQWALAHPRNGVCWPEALPHDEILENANAGTKNYLGDIIAQRVEYAPPASLQFADFMCEPQP